jgi:hypothetical protein
MIPATPGPKIPENGPEPEFQPEFFRNFEPSTTSSNYDSGVSGQLRTMMTVMGGRVEMLTVASVGDCCLDTRGEAKPSVAAAAAAAR